MRKVFLDNLPTRWANQISWRESVGKSVDFIYDDISGTIIIKDYDYKTGYIYFSFNNSKEVVKMKYGHFKNCEFKSVLKLKTSEFKLSVPSVVNSNNRNLIVFERYNKKCISEGKERNRKFYKYKCNICGYNGEMEESHLLRGNGGCACCSNKTIVLGINTIWDTDRWMCNLGVSEEDAKRYTYGSNQKIKVKCPNCGEEKEKVINDIYKYGGISCVCSDNKSFPERFIYDFLKQLNLKITTQLSKTTLEWCGKYRYDFYLPDYGCIIEAHGEQHYTKTFNNKPLSEEKINDKTKRDLAVLNGIKEYIVIDCRHSSLEWIKNNILKSKLSTKFDLSKIDWVKCLVATKNNTVKDICDYWSNKSDNETITEVSNKFNIDRHTLVRYLKRGTELNWCNYSSYNPKENRVKKMSEAKFKPIVAYKDNEIVVETKSIKEMIIFFSENFNIKIHNNYITDICKGRKDNYKGFKFKYKN